MVIDQHNTLQSETDTSASVGKDSSFPVSGIFNLTDRIQIFSYLVSSNRVRWYRVIMRLFLHTHRELYRYQITAHEVRDAVRDAFDPDYTLEQCQNDLAALKEWGNIDTLYDSSRATSIASFLSPALLYQATPEAIAIETFLDEQMRANAGKGSLRQGDVTRLWASLQRIDEELLVLPLEPSSADGRELAEEWQRAFELWNTMARDAAQYLASMTIATQQGRPDLGAYQVYKAAVVAYVQGFAQALTQYGRLIRELLAKNARYTSDHVRSTCDYDARKWYVGIPGRYYSVTCDGCRENIMSQKSSREIQGLPVLLSLRGKLYGKDAPLTRNTLTRNSKRSAMFRD